VIRYRGLTWDHPRGVNALRAAARELEQSQSGIGIEWETQPLEGFESHRLEELCDQYDLVVLDHPHVGEVASKACLVPLEDLFAADQLAIWSRETVGSCMASYRYGGRYWALPLDAAAQVLALRPDLCEERPETWHDIVEMSSRVPVALSIAGPHAILTFFSLAAAIGERPAEANADVLVSAATGERALDLMATVFGRMPAAARSLNPIGLLDAMAVGDEFAACPLVFGYVNYAAAPLPGRHPIAYHDAPRWRPETRPGSTLGGTGIGVSRRCHVTPALLGHLAWLLSAEAQSDFIPRHDGQPSRRCAWRDREVNALAGSFYENTLDTIESACVRPRYDGYIEFQTDASAILRRGLDERTPHRLVLERLQARYARSRPVAAER
jgi:multiple sugar transport system substrate-binding protein